jgi:hypothetical protein
MCAITVFNANSDILSILQALAKCTMEVASMSHPIDACGHLPQPLIFNPDTFSRSHFQATTAAEGSTMADTVLVFGWSWSQLRHDRHIGVTFTTNNSSSIHVHYQY